MTTTIRLQNYVGASLLNARQINLSLRLMTGESKPQSLHRNQVMELLNVIESLAMSSQIMFDNSIQPADKALMSSHNKLYKNLLTPTSLVTSEEWLACCKEAAAQSALLMQAWLKQPEAWADERAVEHLQAEQFASALKEGFLLSGTEREKYALQLLQDLPFLGANAVLGVVLVTPESEHVNYLTALASARQAGDPQLGQLVAGLVNRFRVNYVNELAAGHDAAYVAAPNIEGLKAQQTMLLWRFLGRQQLTVNEKRVAQLQKMSESESQSLQSFPYAYALMMNKRVKKPSQLLDTLFSVRDENLIATQAKEHASSKRFIHDWSDEEFFDTQQSLFAHTYLDLSSYKTTWQEQMLTVGRACLPAMLSVSSAGLGLVIPEAGAESAVAAGMATSGLVMQRKNQASSEQLKTKLYRDNYLRWGKLLDNATKRNERGVSLYHQVETVFGVKVIT